MICCSESASSERAEPGCRAGWTGLAGWAGFGGFGRAERGKRVEQTVGLPPGVLRGGEQHLRLRARVCRPSRAAIALPRSSAVCSTSDETQRPPPPAPGGLTLRRRGRAARPAGGLRWRALLCEQQRKISANRGWNRYQPRCTITVAHGRADARRCTAGGGEWGPRRLDRAFRKLGLVASPKVKRDACSPELASVDKAGPLIRGNQAEGIEPSGGGRPALSGGAR